MTLARLRMPAPFFIRSYVGGEVIFRSKGLDCAVLRQSIESVDGLFERKGHLSEEICYQLDDATILRVVPLDSGVSPAYAVFLEPHRCRISIDESVKRFNLTPRETEVFKLMIGGTTTAMMAQVLSITPATVNDHAASVLNKVGVRRRSELISLVLAAEHDMDVITDAATERRRA